MVVQIIDHMGVMPFKFEYYSPIAAYLYGPEALEVASELMESQPWKVHILRFICGIKPRKYQP